MTDALRGVWAALAFALLAVEAWSRARRRVSAPQLLAALSEVPAMRVLLVAGWVWLGWHFLAR